MPDPQPLQSRLIGALFVERGLVSESQIRVALELQRETGQQLGQILVERFGVSRKELASVVAEQWAKLGGSAGPEDNASWRRLGEIFVERGFVSQEELDQALERQRETGERLGEALVAQGVISKFELAGALAEQMSTLAEKEPTDEPVSEQAEATVHHLPRIPDDAEILYGTQIDAADSAEPDTEVVPLTLATRLGLVDARTEDATEPDPAETPVDEAPVAERAEAAPEDTPEVHDDVAVDEVEEPALDDVGEPELAEAAPEDAPEVHDDVAVDEVEEPALDEVAVDDAVEPELAEAAVENAPDAYDEVAVEEIVEPVLAEAVVDDVGEPVLDEVAADEVLEVPDDVGEAGITEPVFAEAAPEDEPEPVVAETPTEAPARRQRPLPTLVFEDVREPETSFACVAYAPTTRGYRLVPLVGVPSPGETIDVPDVGERLVLRVGPSPLPEDDRMCAFVEEPVVWALTADAVH